MNRELETLAYEVEERVGFVELRRPPVNAMNLAMYTELAELFADPGADVDCVVIAAAGRHFSAGNELSEFEEMTPQTAGGLIAAARRAFSAVHRCEVPVLAAVQGAVLGAGLQLAASCDLVVAAEDSRFGLPEIAVGVMGGASHLARLVPRAQVRLMFLTGSEVPAPELARYGGIARLCPPEQLREEARQLAGEVARHSSAALRFGKRALNAVEFRDFESGYRFESDLTIRLAAEPDAKEALQAIRERREPRFANRKSPNEKDPPTDATPA